MSKTWPIFRQTLVLRSPGLRQRGNLHYLRIRRKAEVIMALEPHLSGLGHPQECRAADPAAAVGPAEESKTMAAQPDAGPLGATSRRSGCTWPLRAMSLL